MENSQWSDQLDNFLTNKMSESQAEQFQNSIAGNPDAKGEMEFQQDLIDTIKENRKAELKAKLSSIKVNAGLSLMQKAGIAAVTISAALLIGFGVTSLSDDTEVNGPTKVGEAEKQSAELATNNNESTSIADNQEELVQSEINESISEAVETPIIEEDEVISSGTEEVSSKETVETSDENAAIVATLPSDLGATDFGNQDVSTGNANAPKGVSSGDAKDVSADLKPDFIYDANKFLYKYSNDQLTIKGDFDEDHPYTLVELSSSSKVYIGLNNKFYELKDCKSFKPIINNIITDPVLLHELKTE